VKRGFAAVEVPAVAPARPDVRAAVILDPFSELAFRYEWDQITFGPEDWRTVLTEERPDLLFVESAWQGNDGRWRLHMTRDGRPSQELRDLVAWCRAEGIPTVFWNKEDPPNYDRFLETARLFDQVFTVDADRIPRYQEGLGHDRIDLLPFAAQPRIHNPVRRGSKRYDVAFAGTWFADKHPDRRTQMEYVVGPAREFGVHIWSRMQKGDKRYRFPRSWRKHVVGSLPYQQMLAAYSSYKVFLNVNSVTGSKTMCSRRLFELSAAQAAVVTAPAASIEPFFGDTVEVVEDAGQTRTALRALLSNDEYRDRLALRAHRRVFDEHLYAHRVDTVLRSIDVRNAQCRPSTGRPPTVSVVVSTRRPEQLDHVLATIGRQAWRAVELVLVTHGFGVDDDDVRRRAAQAGVPEVVLVAAPQQVSLGVCMNLGVKAATGELLAKVDDDTSTGPTT
jgi:spore maturation protein CgeB